MATISGVLNFTVGNASPVDTTTVDVNPATPLLTSSNQAATQTSELRRLVYPTSDFAPIVYETNPDVYTNFHITPLDKRPRAVTTPTLEDSVIVGWLGQNRDVDITERWLGSNKASRMTLDFFLALQDYYLNPPTNGTYIQWEPRDQSGTVYNVVIEALSLSLTGSAGQAASDYEFDYLVTRHGYVAGTVELKFRIVGAV